MAKWLNTVWTATSRLLGDVGDGHGVEAALDEHALRDAAEQLPRLCLLRRPAVA